MRTTLSSLFVATLVIVAASLPHTTHAAVACTFDRDLQTGSVGEDVRCLQKYLNSEGFTVATDGVGSPGNETNLFREKTALAVTKWQTAKGINPATGGWGPLSRALYAKLIATPIVTTPTPPVVTTPTTPAKPTQSAEEKNARTKLLAAVNAIKDAQNEFDSAVRHHDRTGDAENMIDDAHNDLLKAISAFLAGKYTDAADYANSARGSADDAADEIDGEGVDEDDLEEEAQDALDDIEDDLNDARDEVEEADDDGQDTNEADDILDDAEDKLDDAKESFDEGDYEDVLDFVDDISDLIDDALDSID